MKLIPSLLLCTMAFTAPVLANAAESYPSGPINVICTYSPGSPTDLNARCASIAAADEKYFGQPMAVVNKAGAGGMTGWNWVIDRGSRNGHPMTVYNLPNFISQSIVKKTKYNIDNMEPLVNFVADPVVMMVKKDSPFKTVADVVEYAKKNGHDMVFIDTAGRLHNKKNLMDELNKIQKVINKEMEEASKEVLLVIDGTTGQNAISQVKAFKEEANITGLVLTKLDGTAKGGVVIGIVEENKIPIKFIGVGEQIDDMEIFEASDFVKAFTD